MIQLYKGDHFKFSHMPWMKDLLDRPTIKKVIIMKSTAVGKTAHIPQLFTKKRIEETTVEKGLFDE